MAPAPLSAIEVVSPAFARLKFLLFKPFRLGVWVRFAILAFFTGEMSGGGCNFNVPSNFSSSSSKSTQELLAAAPFHWPSWPHMIAIIAVIASVAVVIMLVLMYIASVLRFVLFDSVLTGNVRLRENWRRWQPRGAALFPWQIGYSLVTLTVYAIVFGLPIFAAWRAGIFRNAHQHLALLILGGMALFVVAIVIFAVAMTIFVLTKDFVVPLMAFEGVGPIDGWRRLKPMLYASKGSYAGYVLFKAVLAMAAWMGSAMVGFVVMLVVLIPIVLIAVAAGIGLGVAGGASAMSAAMITLIVIGVVFLVAIMLAVQATISVPVAVFFQSYALMFFGTRYEPLGRMMFPEPPPQAPPVPPMGVPPSPQPAV